MKYLLCLLVVGCATSKPFESCEPVGTIRVKVGTDITGWGLVRSETLAEKAGDKCEIAFLVFNGSDPNTIYIGYREATSDNFGNVYLNLAASNELRYARSSKTITCQGHQLEVVEVYEGEILINILK